MKMYFVGCDDAERAHKLHVPDDITQGAMISANWLKGRKGRINIKDCPWIMDSGAFSQVTSPKNMGDFEMTPKQYVELAKRFEDNGNLLCIVSQDYMCEPSVIELLKEMGFRKPGINWVRKHQQMTVERYIEVRDEAIKQGLKAPVMPVLQGWEVEDYVDHYLLYRRMLSEVSAERTSYGRTGIPRNNMWHHPFHHPSALGTPLLPEGQWVGIGSTCKRNTNPEVVAQILDALEEQTRSRWTRQPRGIVTTMKVHLFGFKTTGLKQSNIKDRIYSADSFAYDFADRYGGAPRDRVSRAASAVRYGQKIIHNNVQMDINLN